MDSGLARVPVENRWCTQIRIVWSEFNKDDSKDVRACNCDSRARRGAVTGIGRQSVVSRRPTSQLLRPAVSGLEP